MRYLGRNRKTKQRRGAIVVLAAVFSVVMLAVLAFAVDMGYLVLARTQLQAAADSAALAAAATTNLSRTDMEAVAKQFAGYHKAGGHAVQLNTTDIEYGTWDTSTRVFTPSAQVGNAVRVTAHNDTSHAGTTSLFFARLFGQNSLSQQASAVATSNPRDIAFVIDLSGSMNDDTEPDSTATLNSTYAPQGYPTIGTDLLNQVYADFGYPVTYPSEPVQCMGSTLGVTTGGGDPLSQMMSTGGPLSKSTIASKYRIKTTDSSSTRQQKAYSWTMDVQVRALMPAARPTPNSTTNYAYWNNYLASNYSQIGYRSYVQYMMYGGRDYQPDGTNYTPLSVHSSNCPMHQESTAGGTFSFPPREQPTHAARRAIIAAIKVIKDRNQNISDPNQKDWVSIITFDKGTAGTILTSLTSNYDTAMQACTQLQAASSSVATTATEAGLITASNHIKPTSQGGLGRLMTNKIVVLLTDGQPNLYNTSGSQITTYETQHPSSNFYGGSNYAKDAAIMQTGMMQGTNWYLYPVGIGLDCDYDFMDRMARMGATANTSGQSPRGSGNPADYEARLTTLFQNIITNPKLRLVQ